MSTNLLLLFLLTVACTTRSCFNYLSLFNLLDAVDCFLTGYCACQTFPRFYSKCNNPPLCLLWRLYTREVGQRRYEIIFPAISLFPSLRISNVIPVLSSTVQGLKETQKAGSKCKFYPYQTFVDTAIIAFAIKYYFYRFCFPRRHGL